jgi:hypothetical protein
LWPKQGRDDLRDTRGDVPRFRAQDAGID